MARLYAATIMIDKKEYDLSEEILEATRTNLMSHSDRLKKRLLSVVKERDPRLKGEVLKLRKEAEAIKLIEEENETRNRFIVRNRSFIFI